MCHLHYKSCGSENIKAENAQDENEILKELLEGDGYTNKIIPKVNL